MSIYFNIQDVQNLLESWDDGIFECAHLITIKAPSDESLKNIYDRAKQTQVEAMLMMHQIGTHGDTPDVVDMITTELAEKLLPPLIRQTTLACDNITANYPEFALR